MGSALVPSSVGPQPSHFGRRRSAVGCLRSAPCLWHFACGISPLAFPLRPLGLDLDPHVGAGSNNVGVGCNFGASGGVGACVGIAVGGNVVDVVWLALPALALASAAMFVKLAPRGLVPRRSRSVSNPPVQKRMRAKAQGAHAKGESLWAPQATTFR